MNINRRGEEKGGLRPVPRQRALRQHLRRVEAPLRERGSAAGVAVCLRGWPRPRLGAGEPGPSRGAFPFSAAENLFDGAIGVGDGA